MIRNFTQENLNAFKQYIKAANPDQNNQIAEQANSILSKYQNQLSRIGGSEAISCIASKNTKTGSILQVSDSKVQKAFDDVSAQDTQFEQDAYDALLALQEAMTALADIKKAVSEKRDAGLNFWDAFSSKTIQETTASATDKLKTQVVKLVTTVAIQKANDAAYAETKEEQTKLAKEAYKYLSDYQYYLSDSLRIIYNEAKERLSTHKDSKGLIYRAVCKIITGDSDKSFGAIDLKAAHGTHFGPVPVAFQVAVSEALQNNGAQYPGKDSISNTSQKMMKNGTWVLDCWGSRDFVAKQWMDKDVYDYYRMKEKNPIPKDRREALSSGNEFGAGGLRGPVPDIFNYLDATNNVSWQEWDRKKAEKYWKEWKKSDEKEYPPAGSCGFVDFKSVKKDTKEDHIFSVLGEETINGTPYKCAIQNCANKNDDYEIMELEDYVDKLQKSGDYINAWATQPAFETGD